MANERLDEILLRKGVITEAQIKEALLRQKSRSGRLGSQLLYMKALTEKQLVDALKEQFGVPGIKLTGVSVPEEVLKRIPAKVAAKHSIFPIRFDGPTKTLFLAMIEPDDARAISLARETAGALKVTPYVAAESILVHAIEVHYFGKSWKETEDQIIELPDLFGDEEAAENEEGPATEAPPEPDRTPRNVLMVTPQAAFLRNLLSSVFEREGYTLTLVSQRDQVEAALRDRIYDHILLSEAIGDDLGEWLRSTAPPLSKGEVSVFSSVSHALLENPVPYARMAENLMEMAARASAARCPAGGWVPPFERIRRDVREVGEILGFPRVAVDGMQLAALLPVPAAAEGTAGAAEGVSAGGEVTLDLQGALAAAGALTFPWAIDTCLEALRNTLDALTSKSPPLRNEPSGERDELVLAGEAVALVWHLHAAFSPVEGAPDETVQAVRSGLRALEGKPFSPKVVEAALEMMERSRRRGRLAVRKDIFFVSDRNEVALAFTAELKREGYRLVEIEDVSETKHLFARKPPDVIILDYDRNPDQAMSFAVTVREGSTTLLYGFSRKSDPSLIMRLLNLGFNDVFTPPFHYEILITRIRTALALLDQGDDRSARGRGFSGTFRELPFVDLIQALAMSQRSVAIRIEGDHGEEATLHLREGRMTHARCGEKTGEEAVYTLVRWGERAAFSMEAATEYPPDNITLPNDFVLMEGLRRMDEENA